MHDLARVARTTGRGCAIAAVALHMAEPASAQSFGLTVRPIEAPMGQDPAVKTPGAPAELLPHASIAQGSAGVSRAWLAEPTHSYTHGVLGDGLEASSLVIETQAGRRLVHRLPAGRVFEDLHARLVDLDGDRLDEIVVVESDARLGASLAVLGIIGGELSLRARSPFIGRAFRWLNPVGAGDFDGDGRLDLALVRTPHIGGVLEIYRFAEPQLQLAAQRQGYSTHVIGSTELGLGVVVPAAPRDLLLLPNQSRRQLLLVAMRDGAIVEHARVELQGKISTSLTYRHTGVYAFGTDAGRGREVVVSVAGGASLK